MDAEAISLLHALKGAAASLLLALWLAGGPLGAGQLVQFTGWSDTQVTAGLRKLGALGLAENLSRYGGWQLSRRAAALLVLPASRSPGGFQPASQPTAASPAVPTGDPSAPGGKPEILDSPSEVKGVNYSEDRVKALTDSDSLPPNVNVALVLAATQRLFGEPVLGGLNSYPDPRLLLAWIAAAYHTRHLLRKPARVVYSNLHNNRPPDPLYLADPCAFLPEEFLQAAGLLPIESFWQGSAAGNGQGGDPSPASQDELSQPEDPSLALPANQRGDLSAADAWGQAVDVLRREMPRNLFERWLLPAELVSYEPQGNAFSLAFPDPFSRDLFASRLVATLQRLLLGVCARPATFKLVVSEAADE